MKVGAWLHARGAGDARVRLVVEVGQLQRLLTVAEAGTLHQALGTALEEAAEVEEATADEVGDEEEGAPP